MMGGSCQKYRHINRLPQSTGGNVLRRGMAAEGVDRAEGEEPRRPERQVPATSILRMRRDQRARCPECLNSGLVDVGPWHGSSGPTAAINADHIVGADTRRKNVTSAQARGA